MTTKLKAPFPWFGGKSRCAHLVWPRFGNVPNYVEPFAGSLAVLFMRPHAPKNETVNDLDCYLANFWRATRDDPEVVAYYADWPVNEADLHARHQWLHNQAEFKEKMHSDPHYFDAKIAGWWAWGISAWIGDNWCNTHVGRPNLQAGGKGMNSAKFTSDGLWQGRPNLRPGTGVNQQFNKRPDLKRGGRGVQSERSLARKRPNISGFSTKGVNKPTLTQQLLDISGNGGASGKGVHAKYTSALYEYFDALASRLRRVRVCCGDWSRILGPSPTIHIGVTAVFLDPPYGDPGRDKVYNHDSLELAGAVRTWCIEHGDEKKLRIALCGYEGEHNELEKLGWDKISWRASGGYGARNPDNKNAGRERIWFSPYCLKQKTLF